MEKRKSISFVGPVLLILAGIVLLLNTLGIWEWEVWWTILRLWPILIIAAGLDLLIGRRSLAGAIVVAILVVLILVGGFWLIGSDLAAGGLTSQTIRQPLNDATQAQVTISPTVGVLRVDALPESANLVEGEIRLGKGEEISQDFSLSGDTATYKLETTEGSWDPLANTWSQHRVWELGLSPAPALQFNADLAVGQSELDLAGLNLDSLETSMGMGQIVVILPEQGRAQARISQGLGIVDITIPRGMAVRINAGTAMAVRDLPDDFQRQGDNVFASPGYATADDQVDLDISLAMGVLTVRYAD
jgi:hypothetical protein